MGQVRMKDACQQRCAKLLDRLNGKYSIWELWNDFITMSACALANAAPNPKREEREKIYLRIAAKYTAKELDAFAEILAEVVNGMEADPAQDFLGELFMQLGLGSKWHGQFFTPYHVCELMSRITAGNLQAEVKERGFIGVNDPACGAGALLIAFANECTRQKVNYQTQVLFAAQDIDQLAGMMCFIQLSLMGCAGYVTIADTLSKPCVCVDRRGLIPANTSNVWFTPMYYRDEWQMRVFLEMVGMRQTPRGEPSEAAEPPRIEPPPKIEPSPKIEPPSKIVPEPAEEYAAGKGGQLSFF